MSAYVSKKSVTICSGVFGGIFWKLMFISLFGGFSFLLSG